MILRYLFMFLFFVFVVYAFYEFINWNKIFEDNFNKKEIQLKEVVLPTRVGDKELSYTDGLLLYDVVQTLLKTEFDVSHYEVLPFNQVKITSSNGEYLLIKLNVDNVILNNNIYSVLTDPKFLEVQKSKEIEYLDFRLLDKVFFKIKDAGHAANIETTKVVNIDSATSTHRSSTTGANIIKATTTEQ